MGDIKINKISGTVLIHWETNYKRWKKQERNKHENSTGKTDVLFEKTTINLKYVQRNNLSTSIYVVQLSTDGKNEPKQNRKKKIRNSENVVL